MFRVGLICITPAELPTWTKNSNWPEPTQSYCVCKRIFNVSGLLARIIIYNNLQLITARVVNYRELKENTRMTPLGSFYKWPTNTMVTVVTMAMQCAEGEKTIIAILEWKPVEKRPSGRPKQRWSNLMKIWVDNARL